VTADVRTPVLGLDPEQLVACVACGLCLPHCPTYRVTGLEVASPRGRIAAMRAVDLDGAPVDGAFVDAMEACVQCRGCEVACPSGVPFGRLMEGARAALHGSAGALRGRRSWVRRLGEAVAYRVVLVHHRVLLGLTRALLVAERARLVPARLGLPRLDPRALRRPLDVGGPGTGDAYVLPGCVMDAWQRDVHRATLRVMRAAGATPMGPGPGADCCGALHAHAGRVEEARRLARRVMASMPGDAPIVVDSAGCGAAMQDYGHLLDTPDAHAFAARVVDVSQWLTGRDPLPLAPTDRTVVVQDPCHLRHVQRAHLPVRRVLAPAYTLVEPGDDGLCCGAGGAYAVLQPDLSRAVRDRKVEQIRAVGGPAPLVASANPGCLLHLGAAGLDVRHPVELLADALIATDEEPPPWRT
jgi:glycolate oxidase iron-sulfur subunit